MYSVKLLLRWHYPNQVTGQNLRLLSARRLPQVLAIYNYSILLTISICKEEFFITYMYDSIVLIIAYLKIKALIA